MSNKKPGFSHTCPGGQRQGKNQVSELSMPVIPSRGGYGYPAGAANSSENHIKKGDQQ
jgi:hypothetical protein